MLSNPLTVSVGRGGDGMLLVRDNSSQLCTDCHALQSHSSETTRSQYGSWSTTCRDCHTPHGTTNLYLVGTKIVPPAVNGYQTQKSVSFRSTVGDSGGGTPSFVNPDRSGPCQVCHTRTQDHGTGLARWQATSNFDEARRTSIRPPPPVHPRPT